MKMNFQNAHVEFNLYMVKKVIFHKYDGIYVYLTYFLVFSIYHDIYYRIFYGSYAINIVSTFFSPRITIIALLYSL